MNLIVNKKPLRIRLIGEIESACEPTYAAPALFMVMEADMTEKKWTDLCRRLQAGGVNQACVFWNNDADFSENELPMKFFEEGEVDEDFEDEWV